MRQLTLRAKGFAAENSPSHHQSQSWVVPNTARVSSTHEDLFMSIETYWFGGGEKKKSQYIHTVKHAC